MKGEAGDGNSSELNEEERRALRGSKFAPLAISNRPSSSSSSRPQPRLAHPGGPLTTNKAAALAKFLERKLQQPGGLDSIDPNVLELAVKNAKEPMIRHVASFDDGSTEELDPRNPDKKKKKKQNKNKKKNLEMQGVPETGNLNKNKKLEKQDAPERRKRKRKKKVSPSISIFSPWCGVYLDDVFLFRQ
ncbi:unnamed protein product [Spirodela intermedia]|uniref:Uncharacterized protein n=1 Tax=Spirodela intermedia TaxID=51605 RepID=A0A7I8JFZ3_SPIIN|nr:unnamed protein product [Spirodela intermedia]CAA6669080.1 unnamed protein product [Spirodela intermedia]